MTELLDIKFQQRFSKNIVSNLIYFVLNVIIGLAIVPFFLDTLGEVAYGLVPLATSVTSYVTLVIDALNAGVSRFLMTDLQRGNVIRANETFNSSFFGILLVVLLSLPFACIIAMCAPIIFNIGDESSISVIILFGLVFLSALIRAGGSNFQVTLFSYNRLDLRNYVNLTNILIQTSLVIAFFVLFSPSLELIGVSYILGAICSVILSVLFTKKISPQIKVKFAYFDKAKFKEIMGVSAWIILSNVANMMRYNFALIVVNIFLGEIAGTEYSLVLMWTTLLMSIAGIVTTTFTPMMYSYRANDDKIGLEKATIFTMKACGLFFSLPVALACVFMPELFTLWVGEEYAKLSPLVWITLLPIVLRIQMGCSDPIYQSYLCVRLPAIVNLMIGILNIFLVVVFIHLFDDGLYGVAYATTITVFFGLIFYLMYNATVLQINLFTFVKPLIYGVVPTATVFIFGLILTMCVPGNNFGVMLIVCAIISVLYVVFVVKLVLTKDDKQILRSCLPGYINQIIPRWLF